MTVPANYRITARETNSVSGLKGRRRKIMGSSSESDGRPGLDIPPDDLKRVLVLARPDKDQGLPHISIAGDTYTEELRD